MINTTELDDLLEAESFAAKHIKTLVQEAMDWRNGKPMQPGCKTFMLEGLFQRVFPAMSHSGVHDVTQGAIVNAAFKFVINQKDKQS